MKRYKEFINEGLLSAMKPKPMEDVIKGLEKLNTIDKIIAVDKYNLDKKYLPSDEEILKIPLWKRLTKIKYGDIGMEYLPSDEEISKTDTFTKMKLIKTYLIDNRFYPSDEECLDALGNMSVSDKIKNIMIYNLDFSLLPVGDLIVDGDLNVSRSVLRDIPTGLQGIPDNLTVNGDFKYPRNNLERIPKNLVVNGNFDCSNNLLKELSSDLVVGGNFDCSSNQLKELPIGLDIGGSLDCADNKIKKLPTNLTVNGDLVCDYNELNGLPNGLNVSGDLWCISRTWHFGLPKDAKIGGSFHN